MRSWCRFGCGDGHGRGYLRLWLRRRGMMGRGNVKALGRQLHARLRSGSKIVEARYFFTARWRGFLMRRGTLSRQRFGRIRKLRMEGTFDGVPGLIVHVIRWHRCGCCFEGRLSRRDFGSVRKYRMEGTFGGVPGPVMHVIHRLRGDGREFRHGAGLGAAPFQHFVSGSRFSGVDCRGYSAGFSLAGAAGVT